MNQSIINCEIAYMKYFTEWTESDPFIRFRSREMPDMYDHNMTLIKTVDMTASEIQACIMAEVEKSLEEGFTFSKSLCDKFIEKTEFDTLPGEPDIAHNGFYLLDSNKIEVEQWKENKECRTKIADSQKCISDLLNLELTNYGSTLGEEFCKRKINHMGKAYLSQSGTDLYLIYLGEELAGKCELLLKNGTAKIEDFAVKKTLRKKYIGTSLLKSVVKEAWNRGADQIYLVADEDDTVKYMYQNQGFKKIGIWTEIFWDSLG